jgi:hypothetical protein
MIEFHNPVAILAVSSVLSVVSGISQGVQAQKQADQQASYLRAQAIQEQKASARELRDLERDRRQKLSRTRAALAASGADLSSGSALALQQSQEAYYAGEAYRIREDSSVAQSSLRARASNAEDAGDAAMMSGVIGGMASGAGAAYQGYSLYRGRAKTVAK